MTFLPYHFRIVPMTTPERCDASRIVTHSTLSSVLVRERDEAMSDSFRRLKLEWAPALTRECPGERKPAQPDETKWAASPSRRGRQRPADAPDDRRLSWRAQMQLCRLESLRS